MICVVCRNEQNVDFWGHECLEETLSLLQDLAQDYFRSKNKKNQPDSWADLQPECGAILCDSCLKMVRRYQQLKIQLQKVVDGFGAVVSAALVALSGRRKRGHSARLPQNKQSPGGRQEDVPDQVRESNAQTERTMWLEVSPSDTEMLATRASTEQMYDQQRGFLINMLDKLYPDCIFSLRPSDLFLSEASCLSSSCGFSAVFYYLHKDQSVLEMPDELASLHVKMISYGEPKHQVHEDAKRQIFELSRAKFSKQGFCEFCCLKLESPDLLEQHKAQVDHQRYLCIKCPSTFKSFQFRNLHLLSCHTHDAPYVCGNCQRSFKTSLKLNQHEKVCLSDRELVCSLCPTRVRFSNVKNLEQHHKVFHLKLPSKWKHACPHCPRSFYKKTNLDSHMLRHSNEKLCGCQECGKKFKCEKSLKTHMANFHQGCKPSHLCSVCGRKFASLSGIKLHMAKHTGKQYLSKSFVCDVCEKGFRSAADLKTHSVVHSKEKPFACTLCPVSFTQRSSLKDHLHVHWNTFQCHFCKKAFGRLRYLQQHEKICGLQPQLDADSDPAATTQQQPDDHYYKEVVQSLIQPGANVQCVIIAGPQESAVAEAPTQLQLVATSLVSDDGQKVELIHSDGTSAFLVKEDHHTHQLAGQDDEDAWITESLQ